MIEQLLQDIVGYFSCVLGYSLPSHESCYLSYDALTVGWAFVAFFAAYSFIASIIGQNCSKVDQLWSLVPVVYSWHFHYHDSLLHKGRLNPRTLFVSLLITLWGLRLSFNFWRKGGYGNLITHEEDYRWPILRKKMHPVLFLLFNLSFIATYQNVLLYLIAVPVYLVSLSEVRVLTFHDNILIAAFLVFFIIETLADEQHWRFQSLKHSLTGDQRAKHADEDIRIGFYRHGLFRYSRHPNYFGEQSMWVIVYLFSCVGQDSLFNWTISGCIQLILLFQGSMNFGESITIEKYPRYREYQQETSQCIPWFPSVKSKSQ
eukprot:gene5077-5442_t